MAELFLGGLVDAATHERTGTDVRLETEDFTTHGVIVGMTGSGKTGLGLVLIEEVLSAGLPALLIDPKGDLTNLCLTFPELAPADFRPWIDEAQARAAGVSPDEFAAAAGNGVARRPGRLGLRAVADRRPPCGDRHHDLHARVAVGAADQHRRLPAGTRHRRPRGHRRRDRRLRHRPARPRRRRRRSALEPRAHPAGQPRPARLVVGHRPRPRRRSSAWSSSRRSASSACSSSTSSSRLPIARRWP